MEGTRQIALSDRLCAKACDVDFSHNAMQNSRKPGESKGLVTQNFD
jgi:hypothetical protein